MKCPNCGEAIPNNSCKCKRCGYVSKALVVESFTKEDENGKQEKVETKNIDPKNVKMGRQNSGGSIFDSIFGGIFGGFGGGISDIFGSLFGEQEEEDGYNDDEPRYYDDFGNPMPYDVFDRDFVEIKKIESYDAEEVESQDEPDTDGDKDKKNRKDKKNKKS